MSDSDLAKMTIRFVLLLISLVAAGLLLLYAVFRFDRVGVFVRRNQRLIVAAGGLILLWVMGWLLR